jgi:hypothetical protein
MWKRAAIAKETNHGGLQTIRPSSRTVADRDQTPGCAEHLQ